jgi:colicin import membrane protein
MKVALEAWGASSNLFHQGFAKEVDDNDVIAATMEKPGIVLRRRPSGFLTLIQSREGRVDLIDHLVSDAQ